MGEPNKTVPTRGQTGQEFQRPPEELPAVEALGEAQLDAMDLGQKAGAAAQQRRRDAFDTTSDAVLTFAEGIVDAMSVGLIHQTGEAAQVRRDVNSGFATGGELLGTALGLVLPGPVKLIAGGGKAAGSAAAKAVIGEAKAGSRAALVGRTAEGAGEMGALMGAYSIGHQVTDVVLDDKEFSASAVIHEAGLGAILGGGVSLLSGVFGRAASRADAKAQGGLLDITSAQQKGLADNVANAQLAWDDAVVAHEQRLGVLKQLEAEGVLDNVVPEFMAQREIALAQAQGARKALAELDFHAAMAGKPQEWARWHKAMEHYQASVKQLDDFMSPRMLERIKPQQPGTPIEHPGAPVTKDLALDMEEVARMDRLMKNPENAAAYEKLYGEPYRPQAQYADDLADLAKSNAPSTKMGTPMQRPGKAMPESFDRSRLPLQAGDDAAALASNEAAPLGRQPLPGRMGLDGYTATGPAVLEGMPAKSRALPIRAPGGYTATGTRAIEAPGGIPGRASAKGYVAESGASRSIAAPEAFVGPPEMAGPFNLTQFDQAVVDAELGAGRVIGPTEAAKSIDNVLSNAHPELARDQLLLPDGHFGSVANRNQNAAAFDAFRQRALGDTPVKSRMSTQQLNEMAERNLDLPDVPTKVRPRGDYIPDPVEVTPVTPREATRRAKAAERKAEGKEAVRRYIDEWYREADAMGPRLSPGDYAAQEIRRVVDDLRGQAAGRDVAAASTDLAKALKLPEPTSALGAQLNDMYMMRQIADLAADASKGTVMKGAARQGTKVDQLMQYIVQRGTVRAAGKAGQRAVGKVLGPYGYFAGAGLAYQLVGAAGRMAGASGRLYQKTIKAADTLLKGSRATQVSAALAPNHPIAYSDAGPIKDPVKRIEELHRVASSPGTMADFVVKAAGDLNLVSPQLVEQMVAVVSNQLMFLNEVAPPTRYDALGRPMPPSAGEIRRFLEAENAVFNLDAVLTAVGRGQVTKMQVEALRRAHTPVYTKIAAFLMDDPEKLAQLERAKLRTIEMVAGVPLSPGADPEFVMRQQMGWALNGTPDMPQAPAQALKIPGAGGAPSKTASGAPTPAQSYGVTGRAPGN